MFDTVDNRLARLFHQVLECLGEEELIDLSDKNYEGTPHRMASVLLDFTEANVDLEDNIAGILSVDFPGAEYIDQMIVVNNIEGYSLCPHHFMPVRYSASVAYLPDKKVVGLSKIPRLVQLLAKRPVMQELLTKDIVDAMVKHLSPRGCGAIIRGSHTCLTARGAEEHNATMVTSALRGIFLTDGDAKQEFLKITEV